MFWFYAFCVVMLIFLIFIPVSNIKRLWPAALLGLVKGIIVDSKFIELKAYSFLYGNTLLLGLPTYYWLSGAAYISFIIYFLPKKKISRLPYAFAYSLALVVMEHIAIYNGYFFRYKWTDLNSIILNFIVVASSISIIDWLGQIENKSTLP